MRRMTITVILLAVTVVGQATAEFYYGAKYAGDFLSDQSNARLLAMGGVGTSIAKGPAAISANPARLGFVNDGHAISLMHEDRFTGTVKVDHLSYVRSSGANKVFGIGIIRQGIDEIPITVYEDPSIPISPWNRGRILEYGSTANYAFLFSTAVEKPYGFAGATAKLIYHRLHENYGAGLGVDLGFAKNIGELSLGARLQDAVGTIIAWDTGTWETIAPSLRLGMAYRIISQRLNAKILPVIEADFRGESIDDPDFVAFRGGLEYGIGDLIFARVGVNEKRLTYGAGIQIESVIIDYAFLGHHDLRAMHRISFGVLWGQ